VLSAARLIDSAVDRTTRTRSCPETKGARGVNEPRSRFPKRKGKGKEERERRRNSAEEEEFQSSERRGLLIGSEERLCAATLQASPSLRVEVENGIASGMKRERYFGPRCPLQLRDVFARFR